MRYFGHDASAMSATEAARIAAVLPLPKKRGAIAPKGFTRRYGNTIAARVGVVGRDGLDACVYAGTAAPPQKAPPKVTRPTVVPGDEYETTTPPPPEATVDTPALNEVLDETLGAGRAGGGGAGRAGAAAARRTRAPPVEPEPEQPGQ